MTRDLSRAIELDDTVYDYCILYTQPLHLFHPSTLTPIDIERGVQKVLRDDLKGAIEDFTTAHNLDEHAPQPLVLRARCYAARGFKSMSFH